MSPKKKKVKNKLSLGTLFTYLGAAGTILTLLSYAVYLYASSQMKPNLFLRLPGERKNFQLLIPDRQGLYKFAVSSSQEREITLESIEVHFDHKIINAFPLDSADLFHLDFSELKEYSYKLIWTGELRLFPRNLEGFAFNYLVNDTTKPIQLLVRIRSHIAPWSWNFPLNLFSPQPIIEDFPVNLRYRNTSSSSEFDVHEIRRLFFLPGENLHYNGSYLRHVSPIFRGSRDSLSLNVRVIP